MFYQIPVQILDTLNLSPRSVVLDPFCGSGTVLVEALLRNHAPIGIDTNPIARLITRAKTTPLDRATLTSACTKILKHAKSLRRVPPTTRLPPYWFTPPARNALYRLHCAITMSALDHHQRDFFLATLTSILRPCSLADPAIPPPVRMRQARAALAGSRYRRALEHATTLDSQTVYQEFHNKSTRNIDRLCSFRTPRELHAIVLDGSALNMPLSDNAVDLVITSPPYCGAQKYIRSFRLELLLLGYTKAQILTLDRASLGAERTLWTADTPSPALTRSQHNTLKIIAERNPIRARMLHIYLHQLDIFAKELSRVMKPSANAFVTFGISTFAGLSVNLSDHFLHFASRYGLDLTARLSDPIPSRGLLTKRSNYASVIPSEEILWLHRPH